MQRSIKEWAIMDQKEIERGSAAQLECALRRVLQEAQADIAELADILQCVKGVIDTPIARRKIQGDFTDEVRRMIREVLPKDD